MLESKTRSLAMCATIAIVLFREYAAGSGLLINLHDIFTINLLFTCFSILWYLTRIQSTLNVVVLAVRLALLAVDCNVYRRLAELPIIRMAAEKPLIGIS